MSEAESQSGVDADGVDADGAQPPRGPIKILLVDDQHLLRMGFRLILEGEDDMEIVGEASDGVQALKQNEVLAPDVILMDVRMPNMDGISATREVTANSHARVIILTTFDLDEYAFEGLQAGASAFLLKDTEPEDLVDAVRLVASGDAVVAPRVTQRLLETYVRNRPVEPEPLDPANDPLLADLTPREFEVLLAIAEGMSNAEIATKFFVSEATVKTHVRKVLTKLGVRDRVQAVVYAYESGLIHPKSP